MPLFRTQTFRDDICLEAMEMLAWQIRAFGAPHLPRVPTVLSRWTALSSMRRELDDMRDAGAWAQDTFARVLQEARMEDWNVECVPADTAASVGVAATTMATRWGSGAMGAIHGNLRGNPVVLYRGSDVEEAGRFPLVALLQLATLRMASCERPDSYSPERHAWWVASTAVFGGAGPDLLNLEGMMEQLAQEHGMVRRTEAKDLTTAAEIMTVMAMRVRRLTPEQMIASYGQVMGKGFRKRVRAICDGIDRHTAELKLLQSLSDGRMCNASAQVELRTPIRARLVG